MLAHKAMHEGRCAVEAIAGHKVAFEPAAIPAVVFTDPEIAWPDSLKRRPKNKTAGDSHEFPWRPRGAPSRLTGPKA